jgi:hypothetical protein
MFYCPSPKGGADVYKENLPAVSGSEIFIKSNRAYSAEFLLT